MLKIGGIGGLEGEASREVGDCVVNGLYEDRACRSAALRPLRTCVMAPNCCVANTEESQLIDTLQTEEDDNVKGEKWKNGPNVLTDGGRSCHSRRDQNTDEKRKYCDYPRQQVQT